MQELNRVVSLWGEHDPCLLTVWRIIADDLVCIEVMADNY